MNTRISTFHLAVAASIAVLVSSVALAHQESTYGFYHFVDHARNDGGAKPSSQATGGFDYAQNSEWAIYYTLQAAQSGPARGMAGPLRTDGAMGATAQEGDRFLGGINGRNTP